MIIFITSIVIIIISGLSQLFTRTFTYLIYVIYIFMAYSKETCCQKCIFVYNMIEKNSLFTYNLVCIPKNLKTNILYQFFVYIITQKFKWLFCNEKITVFNTGFKDFSYTIINQTQIWYDEFNTLFMLKVSQKRYDSFLS